MSIIKGARNLENAKKFYDFALRADVQMLAEQAKAYQVPSNAKASPPPGAPNLDEIKLLDSDFRTYGSSEERSRLLQKWYDAVGSLPQERPSTPQRRRDYAAARGTERLPCGCPWAGCVLPLARG